MECQRINQNWNVLQVNHFSSLFFNAIISGYNFFSPEFTDLEQSLLSMEKLDRASPDIWPERSCKFNENMIKIVFYCVTDHLLRIVRVKAPDCRILILLSK